MADMFEDDESDDLGKRMKQQWDDDLLKIVRDGRIAPYIELEQVITRDELNFMTLIETHAGYTCTDETHMVKYGVDTSGMMPVDIVRRVDHLTHTLGFVSPGNCQAMINRSVAKGYVLRGECAITGRVRYELGEIGRYMLSLKEREDWFEEDRV